MMTDPIADFCTRIRNACRIERAVVDIPANGMKIGMAEALKQEGYIYEYQVGHFKKTEDGIEQFEQTDDPKLAKRVLRIYLKYGATGERVIQKINRISSPGCRVYRSYKDLKPVLDGLGITLLSTSKGIKSDRQARKEKLGGEVICEVW
ncbi:MAG TPA: 30S ribosomal protein S8 [Gemmatales bacterium]|nr:30S ribosomal protein S8 [Gemmatales bacterium]